MAHQALLRIGKIFKVEAEISGRPPDERMRVRQGRTRPLLEDLKLWLNTTLSQLSAKSPMALAIGYSLANWTALTRFVDDGRIEAHNNAAERAPRGVAIGRKNFLHLGSDAGGHSAAVIYTLIGTAKLSTGSTRRHICAMYWNASPTTQSTASTSCCPGSWRLSSKSFGHPGTRNSRRPPELASWAK